jgi:hypothetical protein
MNGAKRHAEKRGLSPIVLSPIVLPIVLCSPKNVVCPPLFLSPVVLSPIVLWRIAFSGEREKKAQGPIGKRQEVMMPIEGRGALVLRVHD